MHSIQTGAPSRVLLLIATAACFAPISAMAQTQAAKDAVTAIQPLDTRVTSIQPLRSSDLPDDTVVRPIPTAASKWGPALTKTPDSSQPINPSNSQLPTDGNLPLQAEDNTAISAVTDDNAPSAGTDKPGFTEIGKPSPDGTDQSASSEVDNSDSSQTAINLRLTKATGVSPSANKPLAPGMASRSAILNPAAPVPEDTGWQYGKSAVTSPFVPSKPPFTFSGADHSEFYWRITEAGKTKKKQAKLKKKPNSSALFSKKSNTLQSGGPSTSLKEQSTLQGNGILDQTPEQP